MNDQENKSGITTEYGGITVDEVSENKYKDNQDQAQIRQIVTKNYPGSKVGNSNSDLLFGTDKFDLGEGQSFESIRVTWIPLPKGTTLTDVEEQLSKSPDARIFRIISNDVMDVLTAEQKVAINSSEIEMDLEAYKEKFLVRDSDGNDLESEMYSQNFFSLKAVEDVDLRESVNILAAADASASEVLNG